MLKVISYGLLLLCLTLQLAAQNDTFSKAGHCWLNGGSHTPFLAGPPLPYPETRPADILWEKHISREIDTRQKLNLVLRRPGHSLFELIQAGIDAGAIQAYHPTSDPFSEAISANEIATRLHQTDTIIVRDPETGEYLSQVITNEFNPDRIQRWRLQEVWYFDARYGKLGVRILGLAPILDSYGEDGSSIRYSRPLYWINYTQARPWLASHNVFLVGNDKPLMSWDDLFQIRRFASYIYRESDILGRRLQDYATGTDLLQKSRQIEESLFNREMDSWSY